MTKNKITAPKKGDRLKFKGYTSPLTDGSEPILTEGDIVVVAKATQTNDGIELQVYREEDGATSINETLFYPDEAAMLTAAEAKEAAPVKAAAKKSKKVAAEEPEETEEAEEVEEEQEEAAKPKATKKAVAKAPARTQEEEEQEEIHHTKSVAKLLKKDDMIEAARSLVTQVEQSYYSLGGVLAEIQRTKAYVAAGFKGEEGLANFVESELGFDYRKAMYLIKIYKTLSKLDIDEARIVKIGWTKLRIAVAHMDGLNPAQIEKLLTKAETMSRDKLTDYVKRSTVGSAGSVGTGETAQKSVFKFTAFNDQAANVTSALESAQALIGADDPNAAFVHIFQEWATLAGNVSIKLEDAIRVIETRFSVKLEVVTEEAETDNVVDMPKKKAKTSAAKKAGPVEKKVASKPKKKAK